MKLRIKIELLSPLQLGNGQEDIILASDAVHDSCGLPYFPAKRFKGLLYESALEMSEIGHWFTKAEVDTLFGHGKTDDALMSIDNMCLPEAQRLAGEWAYLEEKYPAVFNVRNVWDTYTSVRIQTSIDKESGTALDSSLHNMRVVESGMCFEGNIILYTDKESDYKIVTYALHNLRYAGAKRTRGCGRIRCSVLSQE